MSAPVMGDLDGVECESGVNATLKPFVHVKATGHHKNRQVLLLGQIDPATCRSMAMQFLEAAEAAEHDAAVAAEMTEGAGVPFDTALMFIGNLRKRRAPT